MNPIQERALESWRADKLAYIYLTRRKDLLVYEESEKLIDLEVFISEDGTPSGKLFGVVAEVLYPAEKHDFQELAKKYMHVPFPLCLFLFDADTDKGFYKWLRKPLPENGSPKALVPDGDNALRSLTNESISQIVDEVKKWYEDSVRRV